MEHRHVTFLAQVPAVHDLDEPPALDVVNRAEILEGVVGVREAEDLAAGVENEHVHLLVAAIGQPAERPLPGEIVAGALLARQ